MSYLMKKTVLLCLIMILLISCKSSLNKNSENVNYDEFYSILDNLLRFNLKYVSVIRCETMPVYKTTFETDSTYPPDPPIKFTSGSIGIIKCDSNTFISLIRAKKINTADAWSMYNSINPLKVLNIDSNRVFLPILTKTQFGKLGDKGDYYKVYDQIRSKYGTSCFITVSTPVFNSDYTKILFFINYYCGPTWGQGYQFLLEKKNGGWRLIDESGTWES
jgi:hypothetical protein